MASDPPTIDPPAIDLLSTDQVAQFVARGFLTFPGVVPSDLNHAAMAECRRILETWGTTDRPFAPASGQAWPDLYPEPSAIGDVLRSPAVAGIVESLVGTSAVFDHDFVHLRPAGETSIQHLHADAMIDPTVSFDIQLFYFPHAVADDGGGTGFVPGTHLRRIHETQIGRYQHLRGERQWSGPAGSILVFHQGLWHRGMPNPGPTDRLMYKLRLNPTEPQVRRWEAGDLDHRRPAANDHVFATFDPGGLAAALRRREEWMGEQDHRLELRNRALLWRYLTGDDEADLDWYLTRSSTRTRIDRDAGAGR
jgi:hypothetical protein